MVRVRKSLSIMMFGAAFAVGCGSQEKGDGVTPEPSSERPRGGH